VTAAASVQPQARLEPALAAAIQPPDWPLPVRPYLGATLLDARQPQEAAAAYLQDPAKYPDNGWSLHGLARASDVEADRSGRGERTPVRRRMALGGR